MSNPSKLSGYIVMLRPVNCLMMGLAVLIGELISLRGSLVFLSSILGFITAFTLTGGSMVVNDFFDRAVDAVNDPNRPIPRGLVKPREAIVIAFVLALIGLFSALAGSVYVASFYVILVAALSFILSSFYNALGKRYGFAGNLMVSGCVSIPFLYGAFITGAFPEFLLLLFAMMAFLSNTGREIVKGMADVEGDKLRSVKTLPIGLGVEKASYAAAIFCVSGVALSFLPLVWRLVSFWYIPFVSASCAGFLLTAGLTIKNPSTGNARKMKKYMLICMVLGLLAFLFGSILS